MFSAFDFAAEVAGEKFLHLVMADEKVNNILVGLFTFVEHKNFCRKFDGKFFRGFSASSRIE